MNCTAWFSFVVRFLLCIGIISGFCLGPRVQPADASDEPDSTGTDLTVITYNIRVGLGANGSAEGDEPADRLRKMAALIRKAGADIVLLQEVDKHRKRSKGVDEPAFLAKELGFEYKYAPALQIKDDGLYGIAVLSRWPLQEEKVAKLYQPNYADRKPSVPGYFSEQRVLQSVTADTPYGPIAVLNTHLGLTYEQREKQLQQAAEIVERRLSEGPVLLGGDLNSQPDVPALWPLRKQLQDVYLAFSDERGFTDPMGVTERLTFPADAPDRCLDYLFVSDHFQVVATEVLASTLSDHRPVVTRLKIAR